MQNETNNNKIHDMIMTEELQNVRLSQILKDALIKATDTYSTPPQIIWIDNSTIATLGNFSASTGKAKAKKTFNVSALVAASLANGQVLNYHASRYGTEPISLPQCAGAHTETGWTFNSNRQRES
jgi:hypothetical protein